MPLTTEALSIYASCGEFAVPTRAWTLMLVLAERYGWEPRGTAPPDELAKEAEIWRGEPSDWDGRYHPSYGQQVTELDARALADALERALPDIPDHDALVDRVDRSGGAWSWFGKISPGLEVNPVEAFSGPDKDILNEILGEAGYTAAEIERQRRDAVC